MNAIKIGLVGSTTNVQQHAEMFHHLPAFELVGFYDHQQESVRDLAEQYGLPVFDTYEQLLMASDAVDIQTPTGMHYKYVSHALMKSRHVLISKIISEDVREARQLNDLAIEAQVNLKVLQEEKLHPEVKKLKRLCKRPVYIELNRFQQKVLSVSNDSLIFGALLNDLELITYVTGSNIRKVTASATQLFNDFVDFVNVRLDMENGATCNINCGNFENGQNSHIRIFQKSECIRLDLETYQITKLIQTDAHELAEVPYPTSRMRKNDILAEELNEFAEAVNNRKRTTQDVYQAYQSLKVAHQIIEKFHPSTLFHSGMA